MIDAARSKLNTLRSTLGSKLSRPVRMNFWDLLYLICSSAASATQSDESAATASATMKREVSYPHFYYVYGKEHY